MAEVTTTQSYSYDAFGNLQEVDTDGVVVPYTTDSATNRLASATYDAAGNVTSYLDGDGVTVDLVYDALNRLIQRDRSGSTESWRFLYTADDERIAVVETTSGDHRWTLRDLGGLVLREFDYAPGGTATRTRDQIYRGGSLLASTEGSAPAKHYSLDHLGSPRVITDAAGALVTRHKYYPFGEEATIPPPDDGPMKFTGHERDFFEGGEGDDLDYMHARFYSPRFGRFLSSDPIRGVASSPQTWHLHSYVGNNPVNWVDPMGLSASTPHPDCPAPCDAIDVEETEPPDWWRLGLWHEATQSLVEGVVDSLPARVLVQAWKLYNEPISQEEVCIATSSGTVCDTMQMGVMLPSGTKIDFRMYHSATRTGTYLRDARGRLVPIKPSSRDWVSSTGDTRGSLTERAIREATESQRARSDAAEMVLDVTAKILKLLGGDP